MGTEYRMLSVSKTSTIGAYHFPIDFLHVKYVCYLVYKLYINKVNFKNLNHIEHTTFSPDRNLKNKYFLFQYLYIHDIAYNGFKISHIVSMPQLIFIF